MVCFCACNEKNAPNDLQVRCNFCYIYYIHAILTLSDPVYRCILQSPVQKTKKQIQRLRNEGPFQLILLDVIRSETVQSLLSKTGWPTLELTLFDRVLAGSSYFSTMLLLKAETPEPRGRRVGLGRGQRGPVWMGVPPKTHINQAI